MIARIKAWFTRVGIILASFMPAVFHLTVTGPVLWGHQSSAAFEWFIGLWVLVILIPVWTIYATGRR